MSSWFFRDKAPKPHLEGGEKIQLPDGLWTKCPSCSAIIYSKELERNSSICTKCGHHFRIKIEDRINLLCDRDSFVEVDRDVRSSDPLTFKDSAKYKDRLKKAEKATGDLDAIKTGKAKVNNIEVAIGLFNFSFMGGSMGIVVGEKLLRIIELAIKENLPVIIVSASGGARMQEGILSLMQMAKISVALAKLGELGLPYISILTDPTTGGVAASFAMQGDVIITEPGALICFAGPRVIEQTIRKKLPEGFQRSEFLLEHGMVDLVVERTKLKDSLTSVLKAFCFSKKIYN